MDAQDHRYGDITRFTSETLKTEEKLDFSWPSFCHPKLARCPFDVKDLAFEACLGKGVDGMVFKAQHEDKTVVLKIFFHNEQPKVYDYWPFERECMTAALLEKIAVRVRESRETKQPLHVYPSPTTHSQALYNLQAFSSDIGPLSENVVPWILRDDQEININPCYGWLPIRADDLRNVMDWCKRPELDDFDLVGSYCIAYNYVGHGGGEALDAEKIAWHQHFFHLAGFFVAGFKHDNWRGDSTLIDMGDLVSPANGPGWPYHIYRTRYTSMEIRMRDTLRAEKERQEPSWCYPNKEPRGGRLAPGTFKLS